MGGPRWFSPRVRPTRVRWDDASFGPSDRLAPEMMSLDLAFGFGP